MKIFYFLLITLLKTADTDFIWNYSDQTENWVDKTNSCDGKRQSPIDIKKVLPVNCNTSITLEFMEKPVKTSIDVNHAFRTSGEFAKLLLTSPKLEKENLLIKTENGENKKELEYKALQFHIHAPSEHTINGKHYDAELHIVFKVTDKHSDQTEDKYTVLGFFFNQSEYESKFFKNWDIKNNLNKEFDLSLIDFSDDFNKGLDEYYYYKGSFTTPKCDEIVNWFVFRNPIDMSLEQKTFIDSYFKDNESFANFSGNNRKTQDLNGRVVGTGSIKQCSVEWKDKTEGVGLFKLFVVLVFLLFN